MYLCVRGHVFVCVRGIDFAYVYDFDKKLGLPTLRQYPSSTPGSFYFLFFYGFLCCSVTYLYVLNPVLWCPLRFPQKNDVRFVFSSSCLYECSCLIYVSCVCLRIVVSNTHCVVFLLCGSSSCVTYVASWVVHVWLLCFL